MTEVQLVNALLEREGGFRNSPGDAGGATQWGITAKTWGLYKHFGRPATVAEVQAITRDQARAFYLAQYAQSPLKQIAYEPLRVQLFDFGENSGPSRAIRWLQRILGLPVDGLCGTRTIAAVNGRNGRDVNNLLVAARLYMITHGVDTHAIATTDEHGLDRRCAAFYVNGDVQ